MSHSGRPPAVHVVTQAHRSLSDDIAYRQRRYLVMMSIRSVCFLIAVLMFINHLGWLVAIPAVADSGGSSSRFHGMPRFQTRPPSPRKLSWPGSPTTC